MARAGVEPATFRVSVGRSYQLSYLAKQDRYSLVAFTDLEATPTGLEPATFAVTGRRANQLRYGAFGTHLLWQMLRPAKTWGLSLLASLRTPNGIRTRATAVKGRRPRPLDDGGTCPKARVDSLRD